ncbi:MAG TPA: hypothetical protein VHY35_10500 [Stellaceae bacterium]|jgi:hypothetical protein|nr:hypothetical protein [Stellaceae bacterium]
MPRKKVEPFGAAVGAALANLPADDDAPHVIPAPEEEGADEVTAPSGGADVAPEPPQPFDPSDRLLNGRRAESLLSDPLLSAAFAAVAARYRLAWENSPRGDIEAQRVAHMSLAALKDVQGAIRAYVGGAKIFEADLAAKRRMAQAKQPY